MINNGLYFGVIEDRNDPEKMNRVKVRVMGIHSADKGNIPTEDLPWAIVLLPSTSSGSSGLGASPHGLIEGSWVLLTFTDIDLQQPLILGSIASTALDPNKLGMRVAGDPFLFGFQDPDWNYPKNDYKDRSDVNKHARNASQDEQNDFYEENELWPGLTDTTDVVKHKTATIAETDKNGNPGTRTIDVQTKARYGGEEYLGCPEQPAESWSEPPTAYNPTYPYNKVYESESGHLIEIDDTDGAERIHIYHRTGTFFEIHPDGSVVTRIVGKNYEITANDDNVNIKGDSNITVNGSRNVFIEKNETKTVMGDPSAGCPSSRIYIGGDQHIDINGSQRINIGGGDNGKGRKTTIGGEDYLEVGKDQTIHIMGEQNVHIGGNQEVTVMGDQKTNIVGDQTIAIGGSQTAIIVGDQDLSVSGKQQVTVSGGQEMNVSGGQKLTVSGNQDVFINKDADTPGDQIVTVVGDQKLTVLGDQSTVIGGGQNITISGPQNQFITDTQSINIDGNQNINVTGLQQMSVSGDQFMSIGGNQFMHAMGTQSISVIGNQEISAQGLQTLSVTGAQNILATGVQSIAVGGAQFVDVAGAQIMTTASTIINTGTATINSMGPTTINAPSTHINSAVTTMAGNLVVAGAITAAGDIRGAGGGIGLLTHTHRLFDRHKGGPSLNVTSFANG